MGTITILLVGVFIGVFLYDLMGDRKVIMATIKAIRDVKEGFEKTREEVRKNNKGNGGV